jgi:hypothetical protein
MIIAAPIISPQSDGSRRVSATPPIAAEMLNCNRRRSGEKAAVVARFALWFRVPLLTEAVGGAVFLSN